VVRALPISGPWSDLVQRQRHVGAPSKSRHASLHVLVNDRKARWLESFLIPGSDLEAIKRVI